MKKFPFFLVYSENEKPKEKTISSEEEWRKFLNAHSKNERHYLENFRGGLQTRTFHYARTKGAPLAFLSSKKKKKKF